ncbi:MAG: tRNA adenosine(34) deaminase TadA [Phycisphaerales bacterium]|nr:tRNA adenosine(34) deaminase TadA [Phycisphaerales bacterium]
MDHTHWMSEALALAARAATMGEVPVGAVIVHHPFSEKGMEPRIIGAGFNERELSCDPSAHAEIVAMRAAGRALGHWRLTDCTMYVTLEPCPMCAGAAVQARLPRLVYGAKDPKAGAVETLYRLCNDERFNHRVEAIGGVLAEEAAALLKGFFAERREKKQ